jgi:hypothetical protein
MLTIHVELHVGLGGSVETVLARGVAETRLRLLRGGAKVGVEVDGGVEVGDGAVVDVLEVDVEKGREVVLRWQGLVERAYSVAGRTGTHSRPGGPCMPTWASMCVSAEVMRSVVCQVVVRERA